MIISICTPVIIINDNNVALRILVSIIIQLKFLYFLEPFVISTQIRSFLKKLIILSDKTLKQFCLYPESFVIKIIKKLIIFFILLLKSRIEGAVSSSIKCGAVVNEINKN